MYGIFEIHAWNSIAVSMGVLLVTFLAGMALYRLLFYFLSHLAEHDIASINTTLIKRLRGPSRILIPLLAIMLVIPSLGLSSETNEVFKHLISLCSIAVIAWLIINALLAWKDFILSRFDVNIKDNLKSRMVHTQMAILVRIVLMVIVIIAAASMLMTFDKIRQIGMSILASAGIIGIILGIAAQRSIATLFAGLQIAFTQPFRIDDVVIVEGEWGWVEEITLTYVVVKIWDLRRLIVPVSHFLEKPFQNWTRVSADLLGTVFLYLDYTVPVEEIRREVLGILQNSDNWDGKVFRVQVTNCSEHTIELRLLMSASDSSKLSDLRCEVREKALVFLQKNYPGCLPKVRAELHSRTL